MDRLHSPYPRVSDCSMGTICAGCISGFVVIGVVAATLYRVIASISVDAVLESLDRAHAAAVQEALGARPPFGENGTAGAGAGCADLGKGKRMVILVVSGHLSYQKRVKPIMETWGHDLPSHAEMLVVGDDPHDELDIHPTPCRTRSQGGRLCCKLAHGFAHVVSEGMQYDWLLIVDDDTYINVPEWQWRLSRLHGENSRRIFGLRGCGKWQDTCHMPGKNATVVTAATAQELCCGGLCGGAGMAFSRSAVEWIAFQGQAKGGGGDLRSFSKEFHRTCLRCRQHADKAFTILAMRYNVSMETLPFAGMHLGRPRSDFNSTLLDCRRPVLTVHFLKSTEDYARIHGLLKEHPTEICHRPGRFDVLPSLQR